MLWLVACTDAPRGHRPDGANSSIEPTTALTPSTESGGQIGESSTDWVIGDTTLEIWSGPDVLSGGSPTTSFNLGPDCGWFVKATGDLDSDGIPDLALTCTAGRGNDVEFRSGANPAGPPIGVIRTDSKRHWASPLGDLDGDGLSEFGFAPSYADPHGLLARIVPGASIVGASVTDVGAGIVISGGPEDLAWIEPRVAGDWTDDGVPDIVIGTSVVPGGSYIASSAAHVIDGATVSSGSPVEVAAIDIPLDLGVSEQALGVGDVTGDGRDDLLVIPRPFGDGENLVPSAMYVVDPTTAPTSLATASVISGRVTEAVTGGSSPANVGDLDGDGRAEVLAALAVFSPDGSWSRPMFVVPGADVAPSGSISAEPYLLEHGGEILDLVACDLDGDGRSDVLTEVGVWSASDLLTPGAPATAPSIHLRWSHVACLGDYDGDGIDDVAVVIQDLQ